MRAGVVSAALVLLAAAAGAMDVALSPPALLLPCEGLDTCQQGELGEGSSPARAPRLLPLDTDWKERNCMCDRECSRHGDCCDDAPSIQLTAKEQLPFECRELRNFGGIYLISSCPSNYSASNETLEGCENPHSNSTHRDPLADLPVTDRESALTYRNAHCAVCNNANPSNLELWAARLECPSLHSADQMEVRRKLRFENGTWGVWLPRVEPPKPPPTEKEVSDKVTAFLRRGQQRRSNNSTTSAALLQRLRRRQQRSVSWHACNVDPVLPEGLVHLIRRCRPNVIGQCPDTWREPKVAEMCKAHTAHVFHGVGRTFRNVYCAMCSGVPVQELSCQGLLGTRNGIYKDFSPTAFAILFDFSPTHTCHGKFFDPFYGSCRTLVCQDSPDTSDCVSKKPKSEPLRQQTTTEESNSIPNDSPNKLDCNTVQLSAEEFTVIDPDTLLVSHSGVQLREFRLLPNGSAILCKEPLLQDAASFAEDRFGAALGYVTLVCLGVSIICLVLHLLAFCLSKTHRASANNLASLCIALLVAYIAFLVGQVVRQHHAFCVASAVLTLYCFLAAFCWMLAIAVDVWSSLRMATTQLRCSSSSKWKRFFFTSLLCWLIPAMIVLAAVLIENAPAGAVPEMLRPAFAARPGICWFTSRRSLLLFFAAPVSVVMLLNAIFFTSSALMIHTSSISRTDFRLYLRLAVLMGLTWSVGLLAGFLDTPALWVVFVVLNSLQGLFIFLAFTCTTKVLKEAKDNCCCCCLRRRRRGVINTDSIQGIKGTTKVTSSADLLPWSAFSSSVISTKSSLHSMDSSRSTDETLY
ncbi:uncharacterized protein LOC132200182 [Neocloeon triangulifer]|uniref:uncharacterized protein LOC132200182 n=1 Tax=Neocloeon triangulifer TaxID=2078957 RepID=UPI00286F74AC|nr:uncharacterized protein LOC132200182 [Neocloeon triangulifer]XP_059481425.1 uncharacterized protein LOC132200182 [Neocloeon triangulifer]